MSPLSVSPYLERPLRSKAEATLERNLLASGLDDTTRLERLLVAAEQFQVVASLTAARVGEIETREDAEGFTNIFLEIITDYLGPALKTARRIAREREEEIENDPRNRRTPECPACSWE